MSNWLGRLLCLFKDCDPTAAQTWGGWPAPYYGINATCRRCGKDLSVTVPSTIVIRPRR
jgi:hypothetical protein